MEQKLIKLDSKQTYQFELKTAKELGITIKNVKFFSGHDGMAGINADLYYNNKKFASAYDDARGGEMDVRPSDYENTTVSTFHEVETKLRATSKYIHVHTHAPDGKPYGGKPFEMESQVDLASLVDALARHKEELKEAKKGIQYTTKDGDYYHHWGMSIPALMKKHPKTALASIQRRYDELSAKYPIRNTEYLSSIGIRVHNLL